MLFYIRTAVDKLRSMDDAFRKQMDSKEANHAAELERLKQQKQEEIDLANQKVSNVQSFTHNMRTFCDELTRVTQ